MIFRANFSDIFCLFTASPFMTERVNIENFQGPILMNRRNEMGGVRVDRMQYRRWGGD